MNAPRFYRVQPWLFGWMAKHFLRGYGPVAGAWLLTRRHLNAGFFAGRADAPHWDAWAARYRAAIRRTGALVPHDQFALVQVAAHGWSDDHVPGAPPATGIVDRGVPMWNDDADAFCHPRPPYAPIAALHLAGPGKRSAYDVRRTSGGSFRTHIRPGARPGNACMDATVPSPTRASAAAMPVLAGAGD